MGEYAPVERGCVQVDSDGADVDEVLERCEVCRAFDKDPHVPIIGTSTVPMFHGKLRVDLPLLGDIFFLRATDVRATLSLLIPAARRILRKFGAPFAEVNGRLLATKSIQMDEAAKWKHELWMDLCSESRIKFQFQGTGARTWILERRNGLARGIFNRLAATGRFSR